MPGETEHSAAGGRYRYSPGVKKQGATRSYTSEQYDCVSEGDLSAAGGRNREKSLAQRSKKPRINTDASENFFRAPQEVI